MCLELYEFHIIHPYFGFRLHISYTNFTNKASTCLINWKHDDRCQKDVDYYPKHVRLGFVSYNKGGGSRKVIPRICRQNLRGALYLPTSRDITMLLRYACVPNLMLNLDCKRWLMILIGATQIKCQTQVALAYLGCKEERWPGYECTICAETDTRYVAPV